MLAGDHFVWPTLVSGAARLPFLLAFVGIFGGMAAFGLIGLFVGPVIMAAFLAAVSAILLWAGRARWHDTSLRPQKFVTSVKRDIQVLRNRAL